MELPVINKSPHPLPAYQTSGAAGMDISAWITGGECVLKPLERTLISTGLYLHIPEGYEVQVRPRSGLAIRQGITLLNTPGTIDADYRGELKIIVINLSNEIQTLKDGDRIAQIVLAKYERIDWQAAEQLATSERGSGGFGHTGL